MKMSGEEMRSVIRDVHDAIMKNDVERLVSLFTEDATITDPTGTLKGPEVLRLWMKWLLSHFTKVTLKETGLIVEGNKAAHEFIFEGTTPEGLTVSLPGVAVYEFKDGKVQHVRDFYDGLGIAKQMAKGWLAKRAVKSIEDQFKRGLR